MMPAVRVRPSDVDRILEEVRAVGVEWRGTRFEIYRNELIAHATPTPEFVASFRSDERRQRLTFEAGAQIMQLLMAERVWNLLDSRRLKATLRKIFDSGPAVDAPVDDRPRNTLLELVAAALLSGRFSVQLTAEKEDVRLHHPVLGRGAVECKRPLHAGTLRSNLDHIADQLRNRARDGSTYGVAVIGGDRIAQMAGQGFEGESAVDAYAGVGDRALAIAKVLDSISKDQTCSIASVAARALVVVTGAVLVRRPRPILQPVASVIELPLGDATPTELQHAFEANRNSALSDVVVVHQRR